MNLQIVFWNFHHNPKQIKNAGSKAIRVFLYIEKEKFTLV
jgi:hypothetical protein